VSFAFGNEKLKIRARSACERRHNEPASVVGPVANGFFEFRILSLLPHDFHNHPFVPLPIKFGIKNPLPCPQIEFAPGYGHYDFMMNEQRLEMRVAVVFTRVIDVCNLCETAPDVPATGQCPRSSRFHCR
jgi:hypothetical protein